jgi:hypothetical protein
MFGRRYFGGGPGAGGGGPSLPDPPAQSIPSRGIESADPDYGVEMEVATRVFLELAACLKCDPVLHNKVETWVCPGRPMWLSDPLHFARLVAPGAVPVASECPLIKIVPEPRDGQPFDNVMQEATLTARVEIWLASADPISLLNFWGRVQKATLGETLAEGQSVRARLTDVGATTGEVLIEQPILGAARQQQGSPAAGLIGAEGSLSVTYKIRGNA